MTTRWQQFTEQTMLGWALAALCGVLTIWSLVATFERLKPPPAPAVVQHVMPTAQKKLPAQLATIRQAQLFGAAPDSRSDLPQSLLNAKVVGIFLAVPGSHSSAVIRLSGAIDKVYRVGDNLGDGVRIDSITKNSVIIRRNGHLERLVLPKDSVTFSPPPEQAPWH
jgi:general secretion pathway protein C